MNDLTEKTAECGHREIVEFANDTRTGKIIGYVIAVHKELGPGFLESINKRALINELRRQGLSADVEREVPVRYQDEVVGVHRIDLIVNDRVVVETKAVADLIVHHYDHVRSYLRATGLRVGLLVNFATSHAQYRRIEL